MLIKVIFSGSNPKDWKVPLWTGSERNEGDDIAGVVVKVGAKVTEFKPGDRVAAFHEMRTPHGSYAEYAVAYQHTTFHIPAKTSFEEAAALPLAAMTAAIGLYIDQGLPQPWTPAKEPIPLVVYGAASAVGSYAVQFAQRSNIHPIIAVAGKSVAHVEKLIDRSKGDTIIDYREGADAIVAGIKKALGGAKLLHAFDAISEYDSWVHLGRVVDDGGSINVVLPFKDYNGVPETVSILTTSVGRAHSDAADFAYIYFRYIALGLQAGWFRGQPQEIVPGGLAGVQGALEKLRDGKANAIKYIFRIADTEGAGKD